MQIQNFDATNIPPQQVAGKHPEGMFPFQITDTKGVSLKDNKPGGRFVVTFTTAAGTIENGYNLWNENAKAVEIAHKELSALCHATGVFKLTMADAQGNPLPMNVWGSELRGARGVIKVRNQPGNENYTEVEKVFDAQGNEPGKGGAAAAPQPQPGNSGGWGQPPANNAPAATTAPQGWQPGPSNVAPAQQQPGQGTAPPWAR